MLEGIARLFAARPLTQIVRDLLDIFIVAYIIYRALLVLRGTRAIQMGVGPVQFGMMLLLNCALGLVHPPVGTVQFVGCAIGNISIGEATKTAWPYYLAIWVAINLVTYFPSFSTWLLHHAHRLLLVVRWTAVDATAASGRPGQDGRPDR